MGSINILSELCLDENGYLIANDEWVFLRQGDMDGACGPYCLTMGLIIKGRMGWNDAYATDEFDRRKRLGKFFGKLNGFGAFIKQGTSLNDLQALASTMKAKTNISNTSGKEVLKFVFDELENGFPVILGINGRRQDGLNHWVVCIGFSDTEKMIFALDPGYELSKACFWNCVLTTDARTTRFGYKYHKIDGESYDIEFNDAISLAG